jgi:hypothetical protein
VIFEVSRNALSEARKEEFRKKELLDLRHRDEIVAQELDSLRQRLDELEKAVRGRGFASWKLPGLSHGEEKQPSRPLFAEPSPETAPTTV